MAGAGRTIGFLWLLATLAVPAACRDWRARALTAGATVTRVHPGGVSLTVPRLLDGQPVIVDDTPSGSVVRCCEGTRYPGWVTVELKPAVATPPGAWPKTRTVDGLAIHYTIEDLGGGGSGGEEYELRAWRRARDGHLLYTQRDQSELGEPDFDLAWIVIEGTKLVP